MGASTAIRERRRTLRYRNLLVRQMVQMKNKLAMLCDREKQKGNANRATLAVARKLVAYLMAVDRGQRNFQTNNCIAA